MEYFGEYVKSIRLGKEIGLREFCTSLNYDPSRWSKIERGLIDPPIEENLLNRIAYVLGLKLSSPEYKELTDLAFLGRGKIPQDLANNKKYLEKLPLVFRSLRSNDKPTKEQLLKLFDTIKASEESI